MLACFRLFPHHLMVQGLQRAYPGVEGAHGNTSDTRHAKPTNPPDEAPPVPFHRLLQLRCGPATIHVDPVLLVVVQLLVLLVEVTQRVLALVDAAVRAGAGDRC
jgi:hypothetical protein